MSVELDNAAPDAGIVYTVRVPCRRCGRVYALPKGAPSMPAGVGPCCQLTLTATRWLLAPAGVSVTVETELEERPARELGWLGLVDVLCEGCRERLAAGRMTPGVPLCLDCAEETLEHWLAGLVDPYHSWDPSDDPFGSARYPVREWRAVER